MPDSLPAPRRYLVLAVCCASITVVMMDITVVNVALPAIRHDLRASVSGLQWTVDAYTLVLAAFLVPAGSAADRFGRRRVFQIGLAAFGLGSLLCGLAPNVCCESSARDAVALGHRTILVADANAARTDAEHNATLHTFYRSFGDVRPTKDLLELL